MNKQIVTTIIMGIFLLTTVSALYAGESTIFDLGQDYEYYSVVGNSSEVVLDIQQNGTVLTITPNKYSVDDTYEIIFFDIEKETIVEYRGGGGSSRTKYVDIIEYKNVTKYVDKIIEKEVEVDSGIIEKIIEVTSKRTGSNILVGLLLLIIFLLLLWNFKKSEKEREVEDYDYNYKEVNKNE